MEHSKEVLEAYLNAWNRHDAHGIVATFTDGGTYQDSASGTELLSGEAIASMALKLFSAFSDLHFECEHMAFAGQNGAVIQWIMHGTNTGSLNGLPPTHNSISLPGMDYITFYSGKIQTVRGYFDRQQFAEQLGLGAIVQPKRVGPFTLGTAVHLNAQTSEQPGALSVTWIDFRPEDNRAEFYAHGREVMSEMLNMKGHHGTWTAHAGSREITLSAWANVEAVSQINQSKTHQKAIRTFFDSYGSAAGTSVWVLHHLNANWVRCPACGKMSNYGRTGGECSCGTKLPDVASYL